MHDRRWDDLRDAASELCDAEKLELIEHLARSLRPANETDALKPTGEECREVEDWYARLEGLGAAQFEAGERGKIDRFMADADREAKESMRRSWSHFDGVLPPGHKPSKRRAQP
jgi:hypothetical protein